MKKNIKLNSLIALTVSAGILFSSCGASNTLKGAGIGAAAGAAVGAGIGALAGKGKGAAIGAAVGTAVGATTGAIIGKKMDKQKEELAKIQAAQIETVTDVNNLPAIKVTFADGILFDTGKSALHATSKTALSDFATTLLNTPETDVTIYGHTDNTGSATTNEKLSKERAAAVSTFLTSKGVSTLRLTTDGKSFTEPVADNATKEGRAKNRRVEIFITANETMIQQAEQGQ
ncbi:MAG: OmpA family protein [Prevotellaceae bacterium]|jgi:outer membrane protein OmpA-like peptidoglycan-associated protein|nr:OmpA family protein [Prevotellaceae bacterium]